MEEKYLQLQVMVLTDHEDGVYQHPIYLFTETEDNTESVIARAWQLYEEDVATRVIVTDDIHRENPEYPGASVWTDRLMRMGVHKSDIVTVPCVGGLNTFSESLGLVKCIHDRGWEKVGIVAPPFHQLRAFLSVLGAMKRLEERFRVYNCVGDNANWNQAVRHSQGTLVETRRNLLVTEYRRIELYTQKGDLVTADEALAYLDWRDCPVHF